MKPEILPRSGKPQLWRGSVSRGLAVCIGFFIGMTPLLALAQYNPPKRGVPGRRVGAGVRGDCIQGEKPLMPLTPIDAFGATTTAQPTLFWYVPRTVAKTAEFTLVDEQDNELYKTTLPLPATPGVVGLKLPTSAPLDLGKDYRWQLSLICDAKSLSRNPFVEGVIQRVELSKSLKNQIDKASPRDRSNLYAESGVWHEALKTLVDLRCSNPGDSILTVRWTKLLKSVGLGEFSDEALQYCSKPQR